MDSWAGALPVPGPFSPQASESPQLPGPNLHRLSHTCRVQHLSCVFAQGHAQVSTLKAWLCFLARP